MTIHTVQQGDNLSKIARQYKHKDWRIIYNHSENAAFRKRRPNPNLIHPGDQIFIPAVDQQSTTINTGTIHKFKIKPEIPLPDLSWLKVRALYDDPWETPLPEEKIDLIIDRTPFVKEQPLQAGAGKNTRTKSESRAKETSTEPGTVLLDEVPEGVVELEFSRTPGIEEEIDAQRNSIEGRLDDAYRAVVRQMFEFQKQWEEYGTASIIMSGADGVYSGAADWFEDQGELLEAQTWKDLGNVIAGVSGNIWAFTSTYIESKYKEMQEANRRAGEWLDEAGDNLTNWNWWGNELDEVQDELESSAVRIVGEIKSDVEQAADLLESSVDATEKIFRHRHAILALPEQMAAGDVAAIERFVDTVLMDIDPALAQEIKNNPDWSAVLEIIADHETILTYLAYVSLFIEAIPPNFYAYLGGKGGAYVLMEVLLLILCSLLSAGVATAGRLAMLSARISSMAGKAARVSQKVRKGVNAIEAFAEAVNTFAETAVDMQQLGKKLRKGRNSGVKYRGRSGDTLEARKKQQKRSKKCSVCGKVGDAPVRRRKGVVEYQ